MASLAENAARAIAAIDNIKAAIINNWVAVDYGTPVEKYPDKIGDVHHQGYYEGYNVGCDDGYDEGYDEGYNKGLEDNDAYNEGKQAQYDEFWDNYQDYGKRADYHYAFASLGWTSENFYPKYDIKPYQFVNTFARTRMEIDLAQRLEDCGVKLDLSNIAPTPTSAIYDNRFTRLPDLDFSRCTNLTDTIALCTKLEKIDSITISEKLTAANRLFKDCSALKDIVVKGVIPISMSFQYSPLTVDSMKSIISCLKNYKDTDNDLTYTITFSSECWEELEASGSAPDGGTWVNYVTNTLGWNV